MKNKNTNSGRFTGRTLLPLMVVGLLGLLLLSANCRDKPTVESTSDYLELVRYLEVTEEGRALFRTRGLIADIPYTKPTRPGGVVFRDSLEAVDRTFSADIPGGFVEKDFGALGVLNDAYVAVQDIFRVHILADSSGVQWLDNIQQRTLRRKAYFLRMDSENGVFAGWRMHGFNGGTPRGLAGMEIKRSNGSMFLGDGLDYEYIEFDRYVTRYWPDWKETPYDSITVDTFLRDQTDDPYILLSDIARVTKGDQLVIQSIDVQSESMYQIVAAKGDSGPIYSVMNHPDPGHYIDTLKTPENTNDIWDVIFFQEFQFVDRPGGMWCVPYRVQ